MTDSKSPWEPPFDPWPLVYIPADLLASDPPAKRCKWRPPNPFKRGATAAGWCLAIVGAVFVLVYALGAF